MNYHFLRQCLFKLDPERAHAVSFNLLKVLSQLKITSCFLGSVPASPCEIMGLRFPNRIGSAAGWDKNADYIDVLGELGFGHIEVGGVTPRPQVGNPKPRLFRLIEDQALINRMGFNNAGVDYVVEKLKKRKEGKYRGIVGINIAKNRETPLEKAAEDYNYCIERVYSHVDFMTINISSPNTPGLRELQNQTYLANLLAAVKDKQQRLAEQNNKYVPLVVKLSPDLDDEQLSSMVATISAQKMDGVIATNTSLSRPKLISPLKDEQGGLSGKPLMTLSTEIIRKLVQALPSSIPVIAVGGIMSAEDALAKYQAGAQLVQVFTGLVYEGPQLIVEITKALAAKE